MGDNFRKQQAENFRKRRDIGQADLAATKLFSRPEIFEQEFAISPADGQSLVEGEVLMAVVDVEAGSVAVARNDRMVGHVIGEGAIVLSGVLADPSTPGMAEIEVVHVSPLSGVGKAKLSRRHHQDE